jgi:hypothetical protein
VDEIIRRVGRQISIRFLHVVFSVRVFEGFEGFGGFGGSEESRTCLDRSWSACSVQDKSLQIRVEVYV